MDYGHPLEFGTFITPLARQPDGVVALAAVTERAGLDLVTFQDHPYQPAFLDTWTLLSWVAARTERVKVAANVLNLPLRPPAVVARAAASLDLLSGGRFELALGGGAFWEAIAAMGGPRREPRETREALGEAIDIIRAIWASGEPGGVHLDGAHYRIDGAKRGPEPAHDISIWVGALKPGMLRLIGEKADGWLPSLAYLDDGDLERGNGIIDTAAEAAGRDPREIRRLLNITAEGATLERLLPLALEQGVGTFILAADEPGAIERFGAELAPALREAVATERRRAGTPDGSGVRGLRVLQQRRTGIDYDGVPASLRSTAVEPGDRGYAHARSTYLRAGSPGLVLSPRSSLEVAEALAFARTQRVPLAVRSGGHGIGGRSTNDGGIVIDLGRLDSIDVLDPARGRVRLGPGARWGNVARILAPFGLAMSSGDYGGVGVGGLATSGGLGFLARNHGLTIDHVTAAEIVLADGSSVRADAESHADLFWAVRGAGGNFGIVTSFELESYPLPHVVHATMVLDAADTAGLLTRFGDIVERAPRELTSFLYVFAQRGRAPVAQAVSVFASDDTDAAIAALTPLGDVAPLVEQEARLVAYAAIVPASDMPQIGAQGEPIASNGFAVHLTPELGGALADGVRAGIVPWLSIRAVGGAVNDVPADATAFAHRHQNFNVSSLGLPRRQDEFVAHWDGLRPLLDGLYSNFETDLRPERLADAFPGETLVRLRDVKARYDPDNVFDQNFPVGA